MERKIKDGLADLLRDLVPDRSGCRFGILQRLNAALAVMIIPEIEDRLGDTD